MPLIGIIANPSSGKDIRRLVADADGIDNQHKANIVRRVLRGIAAIAGTGSVMDLRFTASLDAGDEDFAVDDFRVIGTSGGNAGPLYGIAIGIPSMVLMIAICALELLLP